MILSLPSPSLNAFNLGPVTIRFYALCLIAGIIVAWMIGSRRWRAAGGRPETFETVVIWAIPIGIIGARVYHVLTHLPDYFGATATQHWWAVWEGGIAIYGAIGAGALGAWLGCRMTGAKFSAIGDALAPGIAVGQAIGRWGNWFNQELYGSPTDLPWGLEIAPQYRLPGFESYATFHPTFLYESLWNLVVAAVLIWAGRRFALGRGKTLALYVVLYAFGRFFTEGIRLDYSYDLFGPIRFNQAMAGLFFLVALGVLGWMLKYRPGPSGAVEKAATTEEPDDPQSDRTADHPAVAPSADAAEPVAAEADIADDDGLGELD